MLNSLGIQLEFQGYNFKQKNKYINTLNMACVMGAPEAPMSDRNLLEMGLNYRVVKLPGGCGAPAPLHHVLGW